jgi:hypothetical protein
VVLGCSGLSDKRPGIFTPGRDWQDHFGDSSGATSNSPRWRARSRCLATSARIREEAIDSIRHGEPCRQDLDRDGPVQPRILGTIHLAIPPSPILSTMR